LNTIKRLIIENFQSHQKTIVDLGQVGELTTIVGPSDSGKTAILRALRLLLFNTPLGTDIRVGSSFVRVSAEYSSGHIVIRERTASGNRNQYKIIAPGETEPLILEGFGVNVPLEITEITGVKPVTIGDI